TAFATTAVTSSLFLTALAPNAAALSIAKKIVNVEIGWAQWFFGFAPLGIPLLLLVPLLAYVICRPQVKEGPEIVTWSSGELAAVTLTIGMILLVSFFFWVHYFFASITSHAAAVLPVVLAVGTGIPGLSVPTLTLLCVYSLGLMGVISPYATGPAPMYFGSGYIGKGDFWKFGLIFGLIYFAGLLVIVLPWLQLLGW